MSLCVDVFSHIVQYADCPTINSLARSCARIAAMVRECADELASRHARRCAGGDHRLPNGCLHGISTVELSDEMLTAEFSLGVPTYWCATCKDDENHMAWGRHGFPYALRSSEWACGIVAHVLAKFDNHTSIRASTCGEIEYTLPQQWPRKLPQRIRARGYIVDGRINTDVVGPWMRLVVASVAAVTRLDYGTPSAHDLRVCTTFSRDIACQFDSLDLDEQYLRTN